MSVFAPASVSGGTCSDKGARNSAERLPQPTAPPPREDVCGDLRNPAGRGPDSAGAIHREHHGRNVLCTAGVARDEIQLRRNGDVPPPGCHSLSDQPERRRDQPACINLRLCLGLRLCQCRCLCLCLSASWFSLSCCVGDAARSLWPPSAAPSDHADDNAAMAYNECCEELDSLWRATCDVSRPCAGVLRIRPLVSAGVGTS